ncbi:ATP-grasp domain-containing protein [Pelagicoccus sp. SDUM812003]|uniref:ATP-grasp domain-containing protein n=1 Tax=Pelagicoccus sp. SDUM812003 TaxID=3041267 RepID=UPI00280DF369|nr:ATP-grasp domain-containing protein [Pelagicoccus sp. SDUM812003]MDQ8201527.1 ATP-grasp domain-containing protein [Pelagicoccus sp. SDUM812003]
MTAPRNGLLLLSSGSKAAITRIAKTAAGKRGIALHASDVAENVPSRHFADHFTALPPSCSPRWEATLLDYCSRNRIGLVIPTRHADLPKLAQLRPKLEANGTAVAVSSPETVSLCVNKLETARHLRSIGAPTPETWLKRSLDLQSIALAFPLIAKPSDGAASTIQRIENQAQLSDVPDDWILQPVAHGSEYTVNLYLDRHGEALCAIPHRRLAVESGEVVQARTERIEALIELCRNVARSLPQARGIINIQAFHQPGPETIEIIEINPRIGGGYPLCDAAKGHYIEWLCREYLDGSELSPFDQWTEQLLMMRYRDAIFSL